MNIWKAAGDPEEMEQAMMRATLCGVSCRDQAELQPEKLREMGKSQVSRLWAKRAGVLVHEINERDLFSESQLPVLMLDGVVLGGSSQIHRTTQPRMKTWESRWSDL